MPGALSSFLAGTGGGILSSAQGYFCALADRYFSTTGKLQLKHTRLLDDGRQPTASTCVSRRKRSATVAPVTGSDRWRRPGELRFSAGIPAQARAFNCRNRCCRTRPGRRIRSACSRSGVARPGVPRDRRTRRIAAVPARTPGAPGTERSPARVRRQRSATKRSRQFSRISFPNSVEAARALRTNEIYSARPDKLTRRASTLP
jgi:hypothetical protein